MNKPEVVLVGEDGNAFAIMGRCKVAAKEAGWTTEEWKVVFDEMMDGDYNHLLNTVREHFEVS